MAIEMQAAHRRAGKRVAAIWVLSAPSSARMGINTGFCTVGNFGSQDRMDYTIIGSGG